MPRNCLNCSRSQLMRETPRRVETATGRVMHVLIPFRNVAAGALIVDPILSGIVIGVLRIRISEVSIPAGIFRRVLSVLYHAFCFLFQNYSLNSCSRRRWTSRLYPTFNS